MRILCTFPGKFGDLLWALPTLRAISRRIEQPVELLIPWPLRSILSLLLHQPYLQDVIADTGWKTLDTAPISPRTPPDALIESLESRRYDQILHLGYRDWPKRPLPFEALDGANFYYIGDPIHDVELRLSEPWITVPDKLGRNHWQWVHGFTDEHFELKYGLVDLLTPSNRSHFGSDLPPTKIGRSPRWYTEGGFTDWTWTESADTLAHTDAFLGCNSALHVLAVAVGCPVVMMEPNPHRHHEIFYPLGTSGPQVTLVRGTDDQPTFDARHVKAVLADTIARRQQTRVDSGTPS